MTIHPDIFNRKPLSRRNHIDQYLKKERQEEASDKYEQYYQVVRKEAYFNIGRPAKYESSFKSIENWISDHSPLSINQGVVDLGCGVGHWTSLLADTYPELNVIGLDRSYQMVKLAKDYWVRNKCIELDLEEAGFPSINCNGHQYHNLDFIQPDAHDLPLNNGSCSLVISILSMDRVDNIMLVLKEVKRILHAGAAFLIITPFNFQSKKNWDSYYPLEKFIKSLDPKLWIINSIDEDIEYTLPMDAAGNLIYYQCTGLKITSV